MKRNDNSIKKTINYHLKEKSEFVNKIFTNFKKLYFDMMVNIKNKSEVDRGAFNGLNKKIFHRMINLSLSRFKKIPITESENDNLPINKEEFPIDVATELKAFLKSCGNRLNNEEIEFMIHLVENFDEFEKKGKKLDHKDLFDIWGAVIHFSSTKPEKVIEFVFQKYSQEKDEINASRKSFNKNFTVDKINDFLSFYHDYFNDEQTTYILEECKICFSREFSLDAFTHMLLSLRKYHPY